MKNLFPLLAAFAAMLALAMPVTAAMQKQNTSLMWDVAVRVNSTEILEESAGSFVAVSGTEDQAVLQAAVHNPTVAIPEPGGLALIAAGLGFGAFVFRKKSKARDKTGHDKLGAQSHTMS